MTILFDSLDTAYISGLSGDDVFVPIYGPDANVVVMLLDSYACLPSVFIYESGLEEFSKQVLDASSEELDAIYSNFGSN